MAGAAYTDIASIARPRGNDAKALPAVARQFESMFVDMMLKAAREATAVLSEGNPFESFETKLHGEMLDHQLALEMSEHGGMGLAEVVLRQLGGPSSANGAAANDADGADPGLLRLDALQAGRLRAEREEAPPTTRARRRVEATRRTGGSRDDADSNPVDFVRRLLPAVRRATAGTGIPPLAVLAQAALETGWGASIMGDGRGGSSNNLFGIKASGRWGGPSTTVSTLEVRDGVARRERAAFRVYDDFEHAVRDLVSLLQSNARYADTRAARDAESYADAVGRSGYATDPGYARKLRSILGSSTLRDALRTVLGEERAGRGAAASAR